ncbi:hypothetical protein SBBP2_2220005 [Burkholderiales bacterium]|nr:hypothetical protein SBBP2_2220005 [Burkholderiales bacterium]
MVELRAVSHRPGHIRSDMMFSGDEGICWRTCATRGEEIETLKWIYSGVRGVADCSAARGHGAKCVYGKGCQCARRPGSHLSVGHAIG